MRDPECNPKVTGSGYKAIDGCEAETSSKALVTCSNLLSRVWSAQLAPHLQILEIFRVGRLGHLCAKNY